MATGNESTGQESTKTTKKKTSTSSSPSKEVKKITITIDDDPEEVVRLSNEGNFLEFDDSVESFLPLDNETISQLKKDDRERYFLAYGSWKYNYENSDPTPSDVSISGRLASATARMQVEGKDPNKHYAWKRPDELREAGYQGYKVARGQTLRSFGGSPSSVHRISSMGEDELVLMEIPKKTREAQRRNIGEKSRRRVKNFDEQTAEQIRRDRGLPFQSGGSPRGGPNFTPTREE